MPREENLKLSRRREAARNVNYNEMEVDTELVKKVQISEKSSARNKDSSNQTSRCSRSASNSVSRNEKFKYQKFLHDKNTCWNFIPTLPPSFRKNSRFSNVLDLDDAMIDLRKMSLFNTESVLLSANDTIYMISEPAGEPYYIGRVVNFVSKPEFSKTIHDAIKVTSVFPAKFFQVRMNWFYRPRDIQEHVNTFNPRLVYASLHQDICPISSYRGKCSIFHKDEIFDILPNEKESIIRPNIFYFDELFDRYTSKYYKVYSTDKILNRWNSKSPFLYVLNRRFRYIYAEPKYPLEKVFKKYVFHELEVNALRPSDYEWDKRCQFCKEWCIQKESLSCDECGVCAHLYCMDPPLDRKPNKDVAWTCFSCLQKQQGTEDSYLRFQEEQAAELDFIRSVRQKIEDVSNKAIKENVGYNTENCWFQYLGIYSISHIDDTLNESMFFPYPFKPSRVGMKYQWNGCTNNGPWRQNSYLHTDSEEERGSVKTSELAWVLDPSKITAQELNEYIGHCKREICPILKVRGETCNFIDVVLKNLMFTNYDTAEAFEKCKRELSRKSLNEPTFTAVEVRKFEEAVEKFGSELRPVCGHVGTQPMSMIVRFYYNWKKTERGFSVRGKLNKLSRNKRKMSTDDDENDIETKYIDDSSFDTEKLSLTESSFQCMFCKTDYSPMWYKVTGGSDEEKIKIRMQTGVNEKTEITEKYPAHSQKNEKLGALCIRCARMWRRYAIRWVSPLDTLRKMTGTSQNSFYSAIEGIIEENNINKFTLSPFQAHNKLLEWELVQDSELIIRQRMKVYENPNSFVKMKRYSMTFHTQLYKMAVRSYRKNEFHPERMQRDLELFLEDKKEVKKVLLEEKPGRVEDTKNEFPVNIIRQSPDTIQKNDTNRNRRCNNVFIKNVSNDGITNTTHPPNDSITISMKTGSSSSGSLSVDKGFEFVKFDNKTFQRLRNSLKLVNNKLPKNMGPSTKKIKMINDIALNSPLSDKNGATYCYPVISHSKDTYVALEKYHDHNLPSRVLEKDMISKHTKNKSKNPDLPRPKNTTRNFCCVCKDKFNDDDNYEIVCGNCGLTVHYFCYAVRLPKDMKKNTNLKKFKWLCDPCSNDLNPILSTTYQCSICPTKEYDYDRCKSQSVKICPDALKCTSLGTWAHLVCSLFNEDVKYGNGQAMQPAINTTFTLIKNNRFTCGVCRIHGGGLVKCEKCQYRYHTTCAQNSSNFKLMFEKRNISVDTTLPCIKDAKLNETYILRPVLICDRHDVNLEGNEFYPLSYKPQHTLSYMEQYCRYYKCKANCSLVELRYFEQLGALHGEVVRNPHYSAANPKIHVLPFERICPYCGTNKSLYWYESNVCHSCNLRSGIQEPDFDNADAKITTGNGISVESTQKLMEGIEPAMFDIDISEAISNKKLHQPSQ
ncbi:DNA-binding E3 ubiquitin-protein ligase SNT2 [Saccharomyces paradoxus]|uniref:DNA-binding E3 ubiquitin-protein ligase SNT2 n=1 Tax=Saccharomyces paradoxus TaxID=27291 RepID=A0A8B8UR67_SACPA|nr:Snt2 [Saccharomyces paradoxus]QHS73207.1 Snt2 [Saccharomyces paradoxus]